MVMQPVNSVLIEAVDAIVNSFKKHSTQSQDDVDVVEALQEFWQMKDARGAGLLNGSNITYDVALNPAEMYVCYVTLPGGSCFGSYELCDNKEKARQSAAKIGLVNSVFNEHPGSKLNAAFVKNAASAAAGSFKDVCQSKNECHKAISTFKEMLRSHLGGSLLNFQEAMSVFQLLHWNGSLTAMKERCCSRTEVIQHYANRSIDNEMKSKMAQDWAAREESDVGLIEKELETCQEDLIAARQAGQELRFHREKVLILKMAQTLIENATDA
uniref:LIX1-like protein n=1 Tax=Phallusia mammillata TaxID=59560 RepID=A0A6F9DJ21_9ASCI|nr:LIX1-like protein [Phallusia mammillata]